MSFVKRSSFVLSRLSNIRNTSDSPSMDGHDLLGVVGWRALGLRPLLGCLRSRFSTGVVEAQLSRKVEDGLARKAACLERISA
jgi:hypothetical protein